MTARKETAGGTANATGCFYFHNNQKANLLWILK